MTPLDKVTKARVMLLQQERFFGTLALYLQLKPSLKAETLSTDGTTLWFNPAYVSDTPELALVGRLARIVARLGLRHHTRRGKRDAEMWETAGNTAVTPQLMRCKFAMPMNDIRLDPRWADTSTEIIYEALRQEQMNAQQQPSQGDEEEEEQDGDDTFNDEPGEDEDNDDDGTPWGAGKGDNLDDDSDLPGDESLDSQPGEGQEDPNPAEGGEPGGKSAQQGGQPVENGDQTGSPGGEETAQPQAGGGVGEPGQNAQPEQGENGQPEQGQNGEQESGEPSDNREVQDASDSPAERGQQDALWAQRIQQTWNVVKRAGKGTAASEMAATTVLQPRTNWRERMQSFIDDNTVSDFSWARPNVRLLSQGYILPGQEAQCVQHVGIAGDSSGSIFCNQRAVNMFEAELQSMMDAGIVAKLTVAWFDTAFKGQQVFEFGDVIKLKPKGGGGTEFAPAFKWFLENEPDVSAVVYLTDMECELSDFGPVPPWPVMWARYGGAGVSNPPFGELIDLIDDNN